MDASCGCLTKREFGILLHITSLPARPSGDLGPDAYRFVDFLASSGAGIWQVLPLVPTHEDRSPYLGLSAHAGNPLLISAQKLRQEALVADAAFEEYLTRTSATAEFQSAHQRLLLQAFELCRADDRGLGVEVANFEKQNRYWLPDYALYCVIKQQQGNAPWFEWPKPLRDREPSALTELRTKFAQDLRFHVFEQFLFWRQWRELKHYANRHGVRIMGDIPMFVAHDSADVWASPDYFKLDRSGHPTYVAGVPPDYFSATGQRWGNPVYEWERMRGDGFAWWAERFRSQLKLFDLLRIDHFRGFESYWSIPADSVDATRGQWCAVPGQELFDILNRTLGSLPLVAEDLGYITESVHQIRRRLGFPGMRVLQFAFDSDANNLHLPHNHAECCVVYTGTHDNRTTLGWFSSLDAEERQRMYEYLGNPSEPMPYALIRVAMASVARLAVLPLQDIMELDDAHRMNTPGGNGGNWRWRFDWSDLSYGTADRLQHLATLYGR